MENNEDYIFGRLNNEMRQIEEQKRLINQRKMQSQQNWAAKALHEIGDFLGKAIAAPFKLLGDLISWLFGR